MKTLFTFIFIFIFCGMLYSQTKNTQKIIEVYGQEYFDRLQNDNPELLNLIDKYVEYGFMVKTVGEGKYSEFVPLETIPLSRKEGGEITISEFMIDVDSGNFNPLKYKYFPSQEFQVFKLKDVDKIIYILPQDTILLK